MTTLTKERIAEFVDKGRARWDEREELGRLALLGLRVEEAPVVTPHSLGKDADGDFEVKCSTTGDDLRRVPLWKRVRLVVEDQE